MKMAKIDIEYDYDEIVGTWVGYSLYDEMADELLLRDVDYDDVQVDYEREAADQIYAELALVLKKADAYTYTDEIDDHTMTLTHRWNPRRLRVIVEFGEFSDPSEVRLVYSMGDLDRFEGREEDMVEQFERIIDGVDYELLFCDRILENFSDLDTSYGLWIDRTVWHHRRSNSRRSGATPA
jgi:hypothetical protein